MKKIIKHYPMTDRLIVRGGYFSQITKISYLNKMKFELLPYVELYKRRGCCMDAIEYLLGH
jgi:hypothetical protein